MKILSESKIAHPASAVFEAYRDRLSEVAAYIDDVKSITVADRKGNGSKVALHNVWASATEIPKMARSFIKPDQLQWDDYAEWDANTMVGTWRLNVRAFPDAVSCSGTTTIVADGDSAKVVLHGDLEINVAKVPGVPRLLARKIGPAVEKFIVAMVKPNLEKTNGAIERFLDAQG